MASIVVLALFGFIGLILFTLWLVTLILVIKAKKKNKKLICQDCEKEVGKNKVCPHCGNPLIKRAKTKLWFSLHFILDLIAIAIALFIAVEILDINIFGIQSTQQNGQNLSVSQVFIDEDYINIRKEPNTNSKILGKVREGEWYDIISEDKDSKYNWIEIETDKGIRGYIAGTYNGEEYVIKRYKDEKEQNQPNNENNTPEPDPEPVIENLTPREKLHKALTSSYYRTYDSVVYTYDFSPAGGTMMRQFYLNDGYYTDFSDYYGAQMLSKYDYRNNIITYTFKWSSYWATIKWNLNTTRWNCESSVNNWCNDNAQDYVDGEMNDTYNEVMEIFNKAGITREEALQ